MKPGLKTAIGLIVHGFTSVVVLTVAFMWWVAAEFNGPGPLQQPVTLQIERGTSLGGIASQLYEADAITSPFVFKAGTRFLNAQKKLKAGEYELSANMSMKEIMRKLESGDIVPRRITIREGLTSYEVEKMIAGMQDIKKIPVEIPAEGTLLPETYDYRKTDTNADLLGRMAQAMTETVDALWEKRAPDLPFKTKEEAITLASIVEKETGKPEERRRVAAVFINRLRRGIPLQTDPTVIYALTGGKPKNDGKGPLGRRLTTKDLEIDSPYNTYKYAGLPPGPIANPGRASIEAVLNPETNDYLYFVADGTGGHVFSSSLTEHNRNVAAWRKIRRDQKK